MHSHYHNVNRLTITDRNFKGAQIGQNHIANTTLNPADHVYLAHCNRKRFCVQPSFSRPLGFRKRATYYKPQR